MFNDVEIWAEFQGGDAEACAALYNTFASDLYMHGTKFTKDTALIEDAIHDLFVTLWNSRERLCQPAAVRPYLFKALRTTLFRKIKREGLNVSDDVLVNFHFDLSIDDKLCQDEQFLQLKRKVDIALAKLTPRQREIIYYRFYQNLGFDEIADIMGMQVRATYKLCARALQTLRDHVPANKPLPMYLLATREKSKSLVSNANQLLMPA